VHEPGLVRRPGPGPVLRPAGPRPVVPRFDRDGLLARLGRGPVTFLGEAARALLAAGDLPAGAERTVAVLVEPVEALLAGAGLGEVADRFLEDPRHDLLVAVDGRMRPVWLVERAAVLRAEGFEHEPMIVAPASPLRQVARRLAAARRSTASRPRSAATRAGPTWGSSASSGCSTRSRPPSTAGADGPRATARTSGDGY